jgi:uncharacterized phage protein (TIGR02220 family)
MKGWIRLYRGLLDSKVWRKHNSLIVWIWCLLKASHKINHISWDTGRGSSVVTVSPGQFITGRHSGSAETGLAPSTWRDAMKFLEKEQMITQKSDTHYTIVTITNWELYQDTLGQTQQPSVQATDTQPTGNQQAPDTNKKEKKEKNEKNDEEAIYILQQFNEITGKSFKTTPKTVNLIRARLKEGYTPEVIIAVIHKKTNQWLNDAKMSQYLRPQTIFNKEKFESYVQDHSPTVLDQRSDRPMQNESSSERNKQYGKPFSEIGNGKSNESGR